jgi:SAM-dependent methyltransferase
VSYAARTKYDEPGRAARYRERSPRRDAREWALLERMLTALDPAPRDVLDVPCGTGRIAQRLLAKGLRVRAADLSPAMRAEANARLAGSPGLLGVEALDLEAAPDPALAADAVVCFRLWHHLPDAATRARVLASLAALARRDVLLSFHHPVSAHNIARLARRALRRVRGDRFTTTVRALRREAAGAGLRVVRARGLAPGRRELWVAHLAHANPAS